MWIRKIALDSSKGRGKDYDWCHFFLLGLRNLWLQQNNKAFKQQPSNPNLVQVVEMQSRELLYCVLEPNTRKVRHLNQIQWINLLQVGINLIQMARWLIQMGCQGAAGCLEIVLGSGL